MAATSVPLYGFAQIGARMGDSIMRRMANGRAEVAGQLFAVHLMNVPALAVAGGLSGQARTITARALIAELPAAAIEGAAITIDGEVFEIATAPVPDVRTGIAQFDLERT